MKIWDELKVWVEENGHMLDHDEGMTGFACRLRCPMTQHYLKVIASWGMGWDHVSAVRVGDNRTPVWMEMAWLKDVFWNDEECVVQYHPPKSMYVNNHPGCLHLWRPQVELDEIPLPPTELIGILGVDP